MLEFHSAFSLLLRSLLLDLVLLFHLKGSGTILGHGFLFFASAIWHRCSSFFGVWEVHGTSYGFWIVALYGYVWCRREGLCGLGKVWVCLASVEAVSRGITYWSRGLRFHNSLLCPPFQFFVVKPNISTFTEHLSSVLDKISAHRAAIVIGLPLIDPELSINKVTIVSLKSRSFSFLNDNEF